MTPFDNSQITTPPFSKSDLYRAAKMAIKLFQTIQDDQPIEQWVQVKIAKAADSLDSIYHYLEYQMKFGDGNHQVSQVDELTSDLADSVPSAQETEEDHEELTMEYRNYTSKLQALLESAIKREGIEDKLAAAREKAAAAGKPIKDTETKKKDSSAVRKVAGKQYGGSKQTDTDVDESVSRLKTTQRDSQFAEGIEDRLAAAREKAAAKGKPVKPEQKPKQAQSPVRKVAGKNYGGSAQDDKVDEGIEDKLAAAREKAAAKGKPVKGAQPSKQAQSPVRKVAGTQYGGSKQRDTEYNEGIEDKLAAAREKAAAKGKPVKGDKKVAAPASPVRKVAGKQYGGSAQKDTLGESVQPHEIYPNLSINSSVDELKAAIAELKKQYDPNAEYSDDRSVWGKAAAIKSRLYFLMNILEKKMKSNT